MPDPRPDSPPDPAARLRAGGLVFTVQRRAIWDVLSRRTDHPTADEVFGALGGPASGISRTTVYRTLEAFVGVGLAQRVGHMGTSVRYDPRTTRHHHLVCEDCGAVRDVEESALGASPILGPEGLTPGALGGFEARELSVIVRGLCPDCRAADRGRRD